MTCRTTQAIALLTGLALAGCASGAASKAAPTPAADTAAAAAAPSDSATIDTLRSTIVEFPIKVVLHTLPDAYASLGMPVRAANTTGDLAVGTGGMKVHVRLGKVRLSQYINCGKTIDGMSSADSYDVVLTVSTFLRRTSSGGTDVRTHVVGYGRPPQFSQEYSRCSSTGEIETQIIKFVRKKLAGS
jgi:uncharacterized protein YceK